MSNNNKYKITLKYATLMFVFVGAYKLTQKVVNKMFHGVDKNTTNKHHNISTVNMAYWYKEEDIARIMHLCFRYADLHSSEPHHGLILTNANKLYRTMYADNSFSISFGQNLASGTTISSEAALYDQLGATISGVLNWNQQQANHPDTMSNWIDKHIILNPLNFGNAHWLLLMLQFKVVKKDENFSIDPRVNIFLFDTLNSYGFGGQFLDKIKDVFKRVCRLDPDVEFIFTPHTPYVNAQPDASSCGVLVTDMACKIIWSQNLMIHDTPNKIVRYKASDIIEMRLQHLNIIDDLTFTERQLGRAHSVADRYRMGVQRLDGKHLDVNNNLSKIIYDRIESIPEESEQIYQHIIEFCRVFNILEKLNQTNEYITLDADLQYFSEKYSAVYAEHLTKMQRGLGTVINESPMEKLYFYTDHSYRIILDILKRWFLKNYNNFATIWPIFFKTGHDVEPEWADNGKDKFAQALIDVLAIVNSKLEVLSQPRKDLTIDALSEPDSSLKRNLLRQYNKSKIHESSYKRPKHSVVSVKDDEYILIDHPEKGIAPTKASATKSEAFEFRFVGNYDETDKPSEGEISCILGKNHIEGRYICYVGKIKYGRICGKGTVGLYDMHSKSITKYVEAAFIDDKFIIIKSNIKDEFKVTWLLDYAIKNSKSFFMSYIEAEPKSTGFYYLPS